MAALLVLVVAVFGCCIFTALLKWNDLRYRKKGLPPGTMGWPLLGETLEFLKLGPEFTKNKRARYGNIFKTHIFGFPTIVSMDPELNKYVLMNEAKGFVPGYPVSMLDILGKYNVGWVYGSAHKTIRGALLAVVSPTMTKDRDQHLAKSDRFLRSYLSSWEGKTLEIQKKTEEMVLLSFINHIGITDSSIVEALKPEFFKLAVGSISLRIDLPGTIYRKGVQARKKIACILKKVIEERQTSQSPQDDMLAVLMGTKDSTHKLNMEEIIDQLLTIMHSSYETVSTVSMMSLKYLQDHPKALQELREEHFELRKHKGPDDSISWNDYKGMAFTRGVILETLRLATVINGLMRKATQDTELNGFVIPKGWRLYLHVRGPNYDPFHYPEPLTFNPWRWKDNKSLESHYNCMLFGAGNRLCPGKELGIAEISIFLHYFVTQYRWEEVGDSKIVNFPRVEAPNGLYMKISKYYGRMW